MPFIFTFTDGYSKEDFLQLNHVFVRKKTSRRILVPLLRLLLIVFGLVLLAFAVEGIIGAMNGTLHVLQIILYTGLAVLELYAGVFYYTRRAARSRKMMLKENRLSFTVTLAEDQYSVRTDGHNTESSYSEITDVIFRRECWFLFLDERHCHILPLRNLTAGDPEKLAAFLTDKTGKQIRYFGKR